MNTITIKGKEYNIKNTLRTMFIWEQIMQRPFEIKTTQDNFVFLYSLLLANNPDNVISWDEFIDALDEDPSIMLGFNKLLDDDKKKDILYQNGDSKKGGKAEKKR